MGGWYRPKWWGFFFNDTATTEIYTLSLHDALPICIKSGGAAATSDGQYKKRGAAARRSGQCKIHGAAGQYKKRGRCRNEDRKSTRLNSSHVKRARMPSSA